VPLALPDIFGSLRLLFGLAFGYIILAEMVNMTGGLGDLILTSQRQGPREHVYIVLVIIAMVAYGMDRLLFLAEQKLFPYREE
jgi:ABC-type nitrate/sulfonate/bicarbonate transport system permease component